MQLFRMFNGYKYFFFSIAISKVIAFYRPLSRKKEARKRNLHFHLPAAILCSPTLRLLQNDSSYVALADIYDRYCEETNITREDPILVAGEKVKQVLRELQQSAGKIVNLIFVCEISVTDTTYNVYSQPK